MLLTYHLTFLLLVTNVGIPVFTHICHSQDKSWSSILIPAKSCCKDEKSDGCSSSCHATKNIGTNAIEELPCCEDQNAFVQLDAAYLQEHSFSSDFSQLNSFATGFEYSTSDSFSRSTKIENKPHGPPLAGSGRQLLLSYGVIRC